MPRIILSSVVDPRPMLRMVLIRYFVVRPGEGRRKSSLLPVHKMFNELACEYNFHSLHILEVPESEKNCASSSLYTYIEVFL